MQSILENLYFGNIRPDSRLHGKDSPYVKAVQLRQEYYEKLISTLDESEKELFDKYQEAQGELEWMSLYNTYTYALKFGALFMTEIFTGIDQITGKTKNE